MKIAEPGCGAASGPGKLASVKQKDMATPNLACSKNKGKIN